MIDTPEVIHTADAGEESLARVARLMGGVGLPIRLRLAITMWDGNSYVAWKGQTWRTEVRDAEGARAVQAALEEFFDLIAAAGPGITAAQLKQLRENTRA